MAVAIFGWVWYLASYTVARATFVCAMIANAGLLALYIADIASRAVESDHSGLGYARLPHTLRVYTIA